MHIVRRKAAFLVLFLFTVCASATLGDGSSKKAKSKNILSDRTVSITHGNFSLKSGYNYRGTNVINLRKQDTFINLNTVATYQKGNRAYIVPVKSKVLISGIKISAGVPQLNR
jgi:hypothetical protein